ncbi:PREDICTED: uncharacterized protein LOC104708807 [Camelina sativa]|uniref:Uncharacterized protein LOC104708807 n=1 Tax=Camelina sativa TaxID=90675 RepID=A0ABM0TBI4_CAMSA|nr:PREDICTED: uncharacterized protein LOC104708807 [Camelina sativa]
MLMKRRRSHESGFHDIIGMVKELQVTSQDRQCHHDEVLTSAIQSGMDNTLHYNLVLANYIWKPGGFMWLGVLREWCKEFQKYRMGNVLKLLVWFDAHNRKLEAKLGFYILAHHSSKNQKFLITHHRLQSKEWSWFKKSYEKGSLLEILFAELVRCKAYVMELLVVGLKMQASHDLFPNHCSFQRRVSISKIFSTVYAITWMINTMQGLESEHRKEIIMTVTRERLSEISLANRVWEPGEFILLVNRVQWEWLEKNYHADPTVKLMQRQDIKGWISLYDNDEELKQSTRRVKMRSENDQDEYRSNGGMAVDCYLEDNIVLKGVSNGMSVKGVNDSKQKHMVSGECQEMKLSTKYTKDAPSFSDFNDQDMREMLLVTILSIQKSDKILAYGDEVEKYQEQNAYKEKKIEQNTTRIWPEINIEVETIEWSKFMIAMKGEFTGTFSGRTKLKIPIDEVSHSPRPPDPFGGDMLVPAQSKAPNEIQGMENQVEYALFFLFTSWWITIGGHIREHTYLGSETSERQTLLVAALSSKRQDKVPKRCMLPKPFVSRLVASSENQSMLIVQVADGGMKQKESSVIFTSKSKITYHEFDFLPP